MSTYFIYIENGIAIDSNDGEVTVERAKELALEEFAEIIGKSIQGKQGYEISLLVEEE